MTSFKANKIFERCHVGNDRVHIRLVSDNNVLFLEQLIVSIPKKNLEYRVLLFRYIHQGRIFALMIGESSLVLDQSIQRSFFPSFVYFLLNSTTIIALINNKKYQKLI